MLQSKDRVLPIRHPLQVERHTDKGMKKVFQTNGNESKKLEVTILISDKMNFKTKAIM